MSIKTLFIYLFLLVMPLGVMAQGGMRGGAQADTEQSEDDDEEDPCHDPDDMRNCWTIDPITGIRYVQVPDTSHINLADRQTMESKSLGLVYTGNLFSPHLITSIFDRRDSHDFLPLNAYQLFAHRPEDVLFWDTRIPYTNVEYHTSGSSIHSNDHLKINFAGNLNKQIGLGTLLDYVYARGDYESSATKPLKWTSYAYYQGERYKINLTYNLQKLANQENGGIDNRDYILNPDTFPATFTDPHTMAVNLNKTWNDMDSWNAHLTHSYDLGFWNEVTNPDDSTDVYDQFTSVASIFHSVDVESYSHMYRMDANAIQTPAQHFFPTPSIRKDITQDSTAYTRFSTYAGIRVNEGFSRWSQFGLSAFVGFEHISYGQDLGEKLLADSLFSGPTQKRDTVKWVRNYDPAMHPYSYSDDNIYIGGQLSRHNSRRLTFDVTGRICVFGGKQGDFDINGQLQTVIPAGRKDSITVSAQGYLRLQTPSMMLQEYRGNYYQWSNHFAQEKRLHLEGKFRYSLTGTEAKVGTETLYNYIYFDAQDHKPHQTPNDEVIQVVSAEITQPLHWRGIHFDNTVLLTHVFNDEHLSLPSIVWRSDLSLRFVIARTLTTQLGLTGYYRSKYYAPTYQPSTQQFAQQRDYKCGDYPLFNAYVNCNLKRLKFYFMYSGLWTDLRNTNTFIMPFYPAQPTRMEYGVVFDLQD